MHLIFEWTKIEKEISQLKGAVEFIAGFKQKINEKVQHIFK